MRSPLSRSVLSLVALATGAALTLGGCSSDSEKTTSSSRSPSASSTPTPSSSPSSGVQVPEGVVLTDQGGKLSFGDAAQVAFESTGGDGSVLELTVLGVRHARRSDFKGFILDDTYKKQASYYYARVTVRNIGTGDVGGTAVPLWGVNAKNTLLPPVSFTTKFAPCPSRSLPMKFAAGATLKTCLVFLSPDQGELTGVSYRPSQQFDPISWTGTIAPAAPVAKPSAGPSGQPPKKVG